MQSARAPVSYCPWASFVHMRTVRSWCWGRFQHQNSEFLSVPLEAGACSCLWHKEYGSFFLGAGCRELDHSSSIQHKIGPFKRLIPVVRLVQVHVYSCTQHSIWYTSDKEVPCSCMYTVGIVCTRQQKMCKLLPVVRDAAGQWAKMWTLVWNGLWMKVIGRYESVLDRSNPL